MDADREAGLRLADHLPGPRLRNNTLGKTNLCRKGQNLSYNDRLGAQGSLYLVKKEWNLIIILLQYLEEKTRRKGSLFQSYVIGYYMFLP